MENVKENKPENQHSNNRISTDINVIDKCGEVDCPSI